MENSSDRPKFRPYVVSTFAILTLLVLVGSAVFLFMRIQSDYYARESIKLGAKYAQQVLVVIDQHRERHGAPPTTLRELHLPPGDPGFVPTLALEWPAGSLLVTIDGDYGKFGTLRFVPINDSAGLVQWRCQNLSVRADMLQVTCGQ